MNFPTQAIDVNIKSIPPDLRRLIARYLAKPTEDGYGERWFMLLGWLQAKSETSNSAVYQEVVEFMAELQE